MAKQITKADLKRFSKDIGRTLAGQGYISAELAAERLTPLITDAAARATNGQIRAIKAALRHHYETYNCVGPMDDNGWIHPADYAATERALKKAIVSTLGYLPTRSEQ